MNKIRSLISKLVERQGELVSNAAATLAEALLALACLVEEGLGNLGIVARQALESTGIIASHQAQLMAELLDTIPAIVSNATYDALRPWIELIGLLDAQAELSKRQQELDRLHTEIADRKADVERWELISSVREQHVQAFIQEVERRVREQLRVELEDREKRLRSIRFATWVITILVSGIVGALIQSWLLTGRLFR